MQIISQSLPTGAFSYSQGLEWAVEAGWIHDRETFEVWLQEQLQGNMAKQELPLLQRLYYACESEDTERVTQLAASVLSLRETAELRDEERKRGQAMLRLVTQLNSNIAGSADGQFCQLRVFAEYCAAEKIPASLAMQGYTFAWLESQVMAGIKLVPLGQTDGQRVLYRLAELIDQIVVTASCLLYTSPSPRDGLLSRMPSSA